jgi:hypothetical protein
MGCFLITREERKSYSTGLNTAVCVLLMTLANVLQKCRFVLRKPLFYPLNYGDNGIFDPFDSLCLLRTSF